MPVTLIACKDSKEKGLYYSKSLDGKITYWLRTLHPISGKQVKVRLEAKILSDAEKEKVVIISDMDRGIFQTATEKKEAKKND